MSERVHQYCTTLEYPPGGALFDSLRTGDGPPPLLYGDFIVANRAVPPEAVEELETWLMDRLAELEIPVESVRLDLIGPNAANFAIFAEPIQGQAIVKMKGLRSCADIDSIHVGR